MNNTGALSIIRLYSFDNFGEFVKWRISEICRLYTYFVDDTAQKQFITQLWKRL